MRSWPLRNVELIQFQNSRSRLEKRDQINGILVLVSKSESEDYKSRSHLDARDWRKFFLGLVSKPESKCQELSVSSRWTRLNQRNSHSRLEIEKTTLADHWFEHINFPNICMRSRKFCDFRDIWEVEHLSCHLLTFLNLEKANLVFSASNSSHN